MIPPKDQNATIKVPPLLLAVAQLALALFVIVRFGLEPSGQIGLALYLLLPLVLLHALLPMSLRRPLVLAATAALMYFLLGTTATAYVLVCGLILIGLCHLPLAFPWRSGAVLIAAALFALMQAQIVDGGRHAAVALPLLGSIFMFRLIIYLYDLRHEKPGTVGVLERLGYFFLLPAPLFLFFPTLDYKAYLRSYYARPAFEIYQTGVLWISRGVTHLVLYRVVYHFFSPPAEFVADLGGVMAFCLSGYLIYLRVSGLFHIIGGVLRMVGYDLPETHRLYFFASGFSDYWRRINIYWKDFMAKVFFFPAFSALGRWKLGQPARVAIATAAVFAVTTVMHSYQTFWLRGEFVIHQADAVFWALLGVLVMISNYLEGKKPMRLPSKGAFDGKAALLLSTKVTGMFVLLCVLWSLWASHTLAAWFDVMKQVRNAKPEHFALLFGFCGLAIALGTLGQWVAHRGFNPFVERPKPARSVATATIPLALLALAFEYHSAYGLPGTLGEKFDVISIDQPNARDQMGKERSYYEGLLAGGRSVGAEDEMMVKEFTPDVRASLYKPRFGPAEAWGATWSTNRWGMRDKYYSKVKPPGRFRIAVSGASYAAGRGVNDGEAFESVVEAQLNADGAWAEMLNFAIAGTCTAQRLADLELRIVEFQPDVLLLFCHHFEPERNLRTLAKVISEGTSDLSLPYLKAIADEAGVRKGQSQAEIIRALKPFSDRLMRETYGRIAEVCRDNEITPVWVFTPMTRSKGEPSSSALAGQGFAREAGLVTIVLDEAYGGRPLDEITISKADLHPNALGHRLLARRLIEKFKEHKTELGLPDEIDGVDLPVIE